jgi:hypothetical protein
MSSHHLKSETTRAPGISRTQIERMNQIVQTEILEDGQDPDFDLETEEEIEEPEHNSARPDALAAVVGAAFDASVAKTVRRRLLHGQALAVVVRVPTPAWVGPVMQYFRSTFGPRWQTVARDGSIRLEHKASVGSEQVAHDLSRGLCVVGVAADVGILPAALVSAADITITVAAPDGAAIRTAITRFTRRSPGGLATDHAHGLDLHHIVSAFRPGSGASRIAQRLASASAARRVDAPDQNVPDLSTAIEYGQARTFGLSLAKDIAAYRAKSLDWAQLPRGICVHGESGLGKSTYFKSLAAHCQVPLVYTNASDWFVPDGYLHNVINSLREVMSKAAALANPCCIVAIDEVEAAAPVRATLSRRNSDFWLPIISNLLIYLDNGDQQNARPGIIVVAGTNNISAVDPALLRAGRLELAVEIKRPDLAGTLNVLRHHVRGDLPDEELAEIAALAERSTFAELMHLVREARRIARHAGRGLTAVDLHTALMLPAETDPETLWRSCVHEAAHAVATLALSTGTLRRCVVGLQAGTGGQSFFDPDRRDPTRVRIEDRVVMLLSGRAAEFAEFGSHSAGAGSADYSDLALGTRMLAAMHGSEGLGETMIYLTPHERALEVVRTDPLLRSRVERDLQRLQRRADALVHRHRHALRAVAEALRARRHLSGDTVRRIFEAHPPASAGASP